MARKADSSSGKLLTVSVVGLSGTEREKGQLGVGKSCLCNRFIRTHADDYNVDHISVLSQSDFSGRVVNNDHFLYWGSVSKSGDNEDQEWNFQLVEQTEFVDDACFQPFKAGKMEPYTKRCSAIKLQSAEKMMYICKNQLGIEKEYEQRLMPDGKLTVDGFICVYDVSQVPGRSMERQTEFAANILTNIMRQKKPVVVATCKMDEACEAGIREAERLVARREFRGSVPLVETSAHENINVDSAFVLLAQMVEKAKTRIKVANYNDAVRMRKEKLAYVTEGFSQLIKAHVQDHRDMWSATNKRLCQYPEWIKYVEHYGQDGTQVCFRRHIRRLKEERAAVRLRRHLARLPAALARLQIDTDNLNEGDWASVVRQLRSHRDFHAYFIEGAGEGRGSMGSEVSDGDLSDDDSPVMDGTLPVGDRARRCQTLAGQPRIPYEMLETQEAASVFKTFLQEAQEEQRNMEWRVQFKRLLEETGYVTPGKQLSEVRVLLMGRECFEALSERQQQAVYDRHQADLQQQAKLNFQELLLEHADLFYHFKSMSPTGTITQEDIKEITDVLQNDFRYKVLDRMEQERKLMLFQHLGFVHCPIREHCPAGHFCVDTAVPLVLNTRVGTLTATGQSDCVTGLPTAPWALTADANTLNMIILGVESLADELVKSLQRQCGRAEALAGAGCVFQLEGKPFTINHRIVSGDFNGPENNFPTSDFTPHGYLCIYSDQNSFQYIRECCEKTLLNNLEQEDKLPFHGLPLVVMYIQDENMERNLVIQMQEKGQNLTDNLHCPYIEAISSELGTEALVADIIQEMIRANRDKASYAHLYRDLIVCVDSDIRIMVCMFCADPFSPERVLSPLLLHQSCFLTGDRSIMIETFLGDSKRKIEIIISSFHGANQFREELIHGFILVYSAKRKASLATLNAFSANVPHLPVQVVAVVAEGGGAGAFFGTDVGHALLTDGNAVADRLGAHFATYTPTCHNKSAFYTPFFKEVWEKKSEIERAFRLGDATPPSPRSPSPGPPATASLPDVAPRRRPPPPPRNHHYHGHNKMDRNLTNSLDLLIGPDSRTDLESQFSDKVNNSKNRTFLKGLSVFPPPSTPPEPAPPDHPAHADAAPDLNCSEDSLSTHDSDGGGMWKPAGYGARAFTTGRQRPHPPPPRPRGHTQTLKQPPGKLDMNNYSIVSDALQHITIGSAHARERKSHRSGFGHQGHHGGKSTFGHYHHPSGVSSETELDAQYAQIKESGEYVVEHAASARTRRHHRRHEKTSHHAPSFSETDSEMSSGEAAGAGASRQLPTHHHTRRRTNQQHHAPRSHKKRSLGNLVPVQSPRVPKLGMFVGPPELPTGYRARKPEDKVPRGGGSGGSESSDASDEIASGVGLRRQRPLPAPPPSSDREHGHSAGLSLMHGEYPSSAQDNDSSSAANAVDSASCRRRHHAPAWPASRHDKRRDKEFSKKEAKKMAQANAALPVLSLGPQGNHGVPIFVEKCVEFIEREGLSSEGLYRVPGNRAHVDSLLKKFDEDPHVSLDELDIQVNAVATALKDYFSKRLPPLFDEPNMAELEDIAGLGGGGALLPGGMELKDRSCRLLALRSLLTSRLPPPARATLDYIFRHFARVAENSKLNSMDSKNLAICWWPTLLPVQFSDITRFELTRPYLEDVVQTMIDQHPFLFRGQEAFVMV